MKAEQHEVFIGTLKRRFEQHEHRHPGIEWADVHVRLQRSPQKLKSLYGMETKEKSFQYVV